MFAISSTLLDQQKNARAKQYAATMPTRSELTTAKVLARNLRALMARHHINQKQLEKLSGVSQRHISGILRGESEPTSGKIDKLAKAFGLKGWQLQVPDLPEDLLDSDVIEKMLKALAELTPEGREFLAQNAEREVFFNKSKT